MEQSQFILDRLESIDSKFDEKLDKILIQTTKTNGRVSRLEEWKALISKVIWASIGIILTIAGFFLQHYISQH